MFEIFQLVDAVAGVVDSALSDSVVILRSPPGSHSLSIGGGPVSLELAEDVIAGSDYLKLRDVSGEGLQGTVSEGVVLSVGAALYTVRQTASASFSFITVPILGQTQTHVEGEAVSTSGAEYEIPATTLNGDKIAKDWGVTDAQFGFVFHNSQAPTLPAARWTCEKTTVNGLKQSGTVIQVMPTAVRHRVLVGKS